LITPNTASAHKASLADVLLSPTTKAYNQLIIYVVYSTIKANGRLTLNQVRHLLFGELLLSPMLIDGAVSVLSSKSLFNCLSMYQIATTRPDSLPNFHLDIKDNPEFDHWLSDLLTAHPEFSSFNPPMYTRRAKAA